MSWAFLAPERRYGLRGTGIFVGRSRDIRGNPCAAFVCDSARRRLWRRCRYRVHHSQLDREPDHLSGRVGHASGAYSINRQSTAPVRKRANGQIVHVVQGGICEAIHEPESWAIRGPK
jgi:hypothetical protein